MSFAAKGQAGVNPAFRTFMAILILLLPMFISSERSFAEASGTTIEELLPAANFLDGWTMEEKVETFSRETLYERIDGEAEMYLPYGFESLVSTYYGMGAKENRSSLAVDIFKMGSSLDAFGIYSNYRDSEDEAIKVGVDGVISESQLMFYQDRYFIHLSASGSKKPDRKAFIACAEAISKKLPPPLLPKEFELFKAPGISPRTEKYVAESLLGYKFFHKGFTEEAVIEGKPVKLFIVLTESEAAASDTLGLYFEYLKKEGCGPQITETDGKTLLSRDKLYKGVALRQSGRYLFGISKLEDPTKGISVLDRWLSLLSF
ncbi:MAG: hypothetical protein HQM09_20290 [Candidatus Riflebacteria bacterium]|nr:hypothetical protein [Candidatus Riflebacteria bacterium]